MTPFHLAERVRGYGDELAAQYRRTLYGAWHGAYLQRVEPKQFPALGKLLTPRGAAPAKPQSVDEAALLAAFQMHNERVRRENGEAR